MRQLQPMPVADAMIQPGRLMNLGTTDRIYPSDRFAARLLECKRVNFGMAPSPIEFAGRFRASSSERLRVHQIFGPQILPFPHVWLEGNWPDSDECWVEGAEAIAFYCHADDARDPTLGLHLPVRSTSYQVFALMRDGSFNRVPLAAVCRISPDGMVDSFQIKMLSTKGDFLDEPPEDYSIWFFSVIQSAMWAIGLMNCRNVTTREVNRHPVKRKKQRRQRDPGLDYHTIVLPGQRGQQGASHGESSGVTRLHQVRGHFKTFTPDAPLLGQHVGTYWWGWQVRGSKENGEVISDYKLAVS